MPLLKSLFLTGNGMGLLFGLDTLARWVKCWAFSGILHVNISKAKITNITRLMDGGKCS